MSHQLTISIVDDDEVSRGLAEAVLVASGYQVRGYPTAEAFLEDLNRFDCQCILLDMNMPGMSGLDLQCKLMEEYVSIPIVFISGEADVSLASAVLSHGAADILAKPIDPATLLESIKNATAGSLAKAK
jgi:FixJ family two-component response regulator